MAQCFVPTPAQFLPGIGRKNKVVCEWQFKWILLYLKKGLEVGVVLTFFTSVYMCVNLHGFVRPSWLEENLKFD